MLLPIIIFVIINGSCESVRSVNWRSVRDSTESNPQPFIDDFARLARITNAISIQDLILQSHVSFREIGAEVLGTGTQEFTTLLETDVAAIKKAILEMFDDKNTVTEMKIDELDEKRMALRFLTDNMAKESDFKKAKDVNLKDIVGIAGTIKGNLTWEACSKDKFIAPALSVLDKATNNLTPKLKIEALQVLQTTVELNACLPDAIPFLDMLQNELLPKILALNQVHNLTVFMDDFDKKLPMLNTMTDFLGTVKKEFSETTNFRQVLASRQAAHLAKVVKAHNDGTGTHHDPLYTSGLPNGYDDLIKIKDDINSQWFFENVAYGNKTNVKTVEKGLTAFEKFTKEIEKLRDSWKGFHRQDTGRFAEFAEDWRKAEVYSMIAGIEESFDKSAAALRKCLPNSPQNVDFTVFRKTHQELNSIAKIVENLKGNLEKMRSEVDSTKLAAFFINLGSVRLTKNYEVGAKSIKALPNYNVFHQYAIFVKNATDLEKELQSEVEKFNTTVQDVPKIFDDSKLLEMLDCLKTEQFNDQAESIEFLERSYNLTVNNEAKEVVLKYLDALENVQNEEKSMGEVVDSMRKSAVPGFVSFPRHTFADVGNGMRMLKKMEKALQNRNLLEEVITLNHTVSSKIIRLAYHYRDSVIAEAFINPLEAFGKMIDKLEKLSAATTDGSFASMTSVFQMALGIPGLRWNQENLKRIINEIKRDSPNEAAKVSAMATLDLDFVKNNWYSSAASLDSVKGFFDELFGRIPRRRDTTITQEPSTSSWMVMGITVGFLFMCMMVLLLGFGLSRRGRRMYRNKRLYQKQDMEEFERRWRYSLFMDTDNKVNALISAAQIGSCYSARRLVKNGAYINAYSKTGQTALHIAVQQGNFELVKLLIESGADRTLLNSKNQTPEDLIQVDPGRILKFEKVQKLFAKYLDKKFKIRVPREFPTDQFKVLIDDRSDASVRRMFQWRFGNQMTLTSETITTTTITHFICQTNESGLLETDDVDLLAPIFLGIIIVKESWMADSVRDDKVIREDVKYLVESVKYKGTIYENCVLPWSRAQAKGAMPYLIGVHVRFMTKDCARISILRRIINELGGTILEHSPLKERYNTGAHPYLHTHLGPIFIIHDGSADLAAYQCDKDHMFSVFTEEEFIMFLLKREVHQNSEKSVVPLLKDC